MPWRKAITDSFPKAFKVIGEPNNEHGDCGRRPGDDETDRDDRRKTRLKPGDKPKPGVGPGGPVGPTPASTRWVRSSAKPVTALNVFKPQVRESRRDGDVLKKLSPTRT